ncbi:helix-turn-helix domain-containing protein [Mycolicibacterium austroafricanum]|uniref:Helix-turn-helix domain-containing protein n=1 Tax=Mycolicibacterium austroafricanum TaxID=39687 RepID=A0ABT8HBJ0_MYCAO|nr:helix-turn-helix domain-containing protein [Mycolicibacterium austroafricanum]MDN4518141.1 helix-turn-helix domain-containing protein [Mycolicibacterium austroafricanum]
MTVSERAAAVAAAELAKLYADTGLDLSMLPVIMTAEELAPAIHVSVGSLAQDRYRNRGIPYIRMGRRIRYARADVARYLAANRSEVA